MDQKCVTHFDGKWCRLFKFWLATALFIFISSGPAHGKQCVDPDVWAPEDCTLKVLRVKRDLHFTIICTKKVDELGIELYADGLPDKDDIESSHHGDKYQYNQNSRTANFRFKGLVLGKEYHYALKVKDKIGCTSFVAGSAWTNRRQFMMLLKQIYIQDDGDSTSDGEMEIFVRTSPDPVGGYLVLGDKDEGWASTGKTYTSIKNNKTMKIWNVPQEGVNIYVDVKEYDDNYDEPFKDYADGRIWLNLDDWESNNKSQDEWSVWADSSYLSLRADFEGWILYLTNSEDKPSLLQSEKLKYSQTPESSDDISKIKLFKLYKPQAPEINEPISGKPYLRVPINIISYSKKGYPGIASLSIEFQYKSGRGSWQPKTVGSGFENIPYPGPELSGSIGNNAFPLKGQWRMRVRSITKYGVPSNWSQWRAFNVLEELKTTTKTVPHYIKTPDNQVEWEIGIKAKIVWLATDVSKRVKISLWKGGAFIGNITNNFKAPSTSNKPGELSYSWRVGDYVGGTATAGDNYTIKIEENGRPPIESKKYFGIYEKKTKKRTVKVPKTESKTPSKERVNPNKRTN